MWNNRNITIYGLGRSGMASVRYLADKGASLFVSDSGPVESVPAELIDELDRIGVRYEFGGHSDKAIDFADLHLVSPGIKPTAEIIAKARRTGKDVIADIELASRETRVPIIGITGTNGKSTTTTLVSYILEHSGKKAPTCGNIGVPILSLLDRELDYLVAEISSFQLTYSPGFSPYISAWLNLTPDHLDWHKDLDEYIDAKRRMFKNQHLGQFAVLNMDDAVVATTPCVAEIFPFSRESELEECVQGVYVSDGFICCRRGMRDDVVIAVEDLAIKGSHNLENALAATAISVLAGADLASIAYCLKNFQGLEHRLEYVGGANGVDFYNDSKATNTTSAIKAIESFPGRQVVLIAGGKDKGTSLVEFAQVVRKHCSSVILFGEASARFEQSMMSAGVQNIYPVASLEAAVKLAAQLNQGPVVFSPACSSFDMFKNYEERGRVFKEIVRKRLEETSSAAQ